MGFNSGFKGLTGFLKLQLFMYLYVTLKLDALLVSV